MKWISSGGGSHASNSRHASAPVKETQHRPVRVRKDDTQDLPPISPSPRPAQAAQRPVQSSARMQTQTSPAARTQQTARVTSVPSATGRVYSQQQPRPQYVQPSQTARVNPAPAATGRLTGTQQTAYRPQAAATGRLNPRPVPGALPADAVSRKLPTSANGRAYISPKSAAAKPQREKPTRVVHEPTPEPTAEELDAMARLPGAKEGRAKPAGRKKKVRRRLIGWAITLVVLVCLYLFCVYTTVPFVANLRSLYIETAMTTMEHQWLATYFIPHSVIADTMAELDKLEARQDTMESDWSSYEAPTTTVLPSTQKIDPNIQPSETDENPDGNDTENVPEPVVLEFWEDPDHEFWQVYSELDYESFHEYANLHHDEMYSEDGYLFIDDADAQSKGTDILTKQGDHVLAIDAKNGIILVRLKGSEYEGVMAIIKDPKQISMAVATHLGAYGSKIATLAEENDAILAINASGFQDDDGLGNGGVLYGMLYIDGEKIQGTAGSNYKAIYFDSNYRLNVRSYKKDLDIYTGVEFKPALVINGEAAVTGSAGWGIQPRSAIGQTDDGTVLMIIVDGRQPTYSVGITVGDMAQIFIDYGAVQAGNLDGGSSAVMYYNGRVITKPSGADKVNGRKLPDAFVVKARDVVYGQTEAPAEPE